MINNKLKVLIAILVTLLIFSFFAFLFIQRLLVQPSVVRSKNRPELSYSTSHLLPSPITIPNSTPTLTLNTASSQNITNSMQTFNRLSDIIDKEYCDSFNYEGTLAWAESYLQQGYIYAYKATGDRQYLDKLIKHIDLVLSHRNDQMETSDFRGQSGPAWRASGHYTFATTTLLGGEDEKILKLKTNFYTAGSCANDRRTCMQAEVSSGTKPYTFRVRLVYQKPVGTISGEYLFDNLTMDQLSPNYAVDIINAGVPNGTKPVTAIRLSPTSDMAQPSYVQITDFEDSYYNFMVHSAMICYPMAIFAEEVYNSNLKYNNFYRGKADDYITKIKESIAYHDSEFVTLSDGSGYFKFVEDNPAELAGEVPYNMGLTMGRIMLKLLLLPPQAPITKTEQMLYKKRIEALAKNFQKSFRLLEDGYVWEYWKNKGTLENPVHGHTDVQFVYQAYKANIVFTENDVKKIINTFVKKTYNYETNHLSLTIDGQGKQGEYDYAAAFWLPIDELNPEIYIITDNIYTDYYDMSDEDINKQDFFVQARITAGWAMLAYYEKIF